MDINNPEYCKSLTGQHEQLPQEFAKAIQVKNSTAALVSLTEDTQLMPYSYALVSPNNKRLDKLVANKKIKIISFSVSDTATIDGSADETAPKKKRQSKSSKSTSSPHLDAAVAELASIVAAPASHEVEEPKDLDIKVENDLSEDDAKGAPEDNNESV